jgi:small subunit ribosomal protein S9
MSFKYIAIARGYITGIFNGWREASGLVTGYPNNCYKGFDSRRDAIRWLWININNPDLFYEAIKSSWVKIPEKYISELIYQEIGFLYPGDTQLEHVTSDDHKNNDRSICFVIDHNQSGREIHSNQINELEKSTANFELENNISQKTGRWGENFVFLKLRSEYQNLSGDTVVEDTDYGFRVSVNGKNLINLEWLNKIIESNKSPDMMIYHENGKEDFIEVKTTQSENINQVPLSPTEWDLAYKLKDRYVLMLVTNAGTSAARIKRIVNPLSGVLYNSKKITNQNKEDAQININYNQNRDEDRQVNRYYEGIGRRKTSTARVRVNSKGGGQFIILRKNENGKPCTLKDSFSREGDIQAILKPLIITGYSDRVDITIRVSGGGISGQVGAIQLGLARAILRMDPNTSGILRTAGLLTRDPRSKERKKPGLKRARKAPTYTKR